MAKTILITGTSSGIGEATVRFFAQKGWNVIATSRSPQPSKFSDFQNVLCCKLDITDKSNIKRVFKRGVQAFGKIDVVVNNAGFGLTGIFEDIDDAQIRQLFEINVYGLMNVTREAIKHMRTTGGGRIIQISSMGGRLTFPLYSVYHASKWAVEGFSEALQFELEGQNIRIKIIEPGVIKTAFYGQKKDSPLPLSNKSYKEFLAKTASKSNQDSESGESPALVAKAIYKAATDKRRRLRYIVGKPAPLLLFLRKILPESFYFFLIRKYYKI